MLSSNVKKYLIEYAIYVAFIHLYPGYKPWKKWAGNRTLTWDTWSYTHLVWGAIARYQDVSFNELLILGVGNEIFEFIWHYFKFPGIWGEGETLANSLVDLVTNQVGWASLNIFV